MKKIQQTKLHFKKLLTEINGMEMVFEELGKIIVPESPLYNTYVIAKASYKESMSRVYQGVISDESAAINYNIATKRLLFIIDNLKKSNIADTYLSNYKLEVKKGNIYYDIAEKMALKKQTRCEVRLAFDQITLLENIQEPDGKIKDIRVSKTMQANLIDPFGGEYFLINNINEDIQTLNEEEYTQWIFMVKPLAKGNHPLMLKIAVLEQIEGKERKKEFVLEESVNVVVDNDEITYLNKENKFKTFPEQLSFISSLNEYENEKLAKKIAIPFLERILGTSIKRIVIVTSFLLMFSLTGVFAFNFIKHELFWDNIQSQNTEEAYSKYLEKYENGKYREYAVWKVAQFENSTDKYKNYIKLFPEGIYKEYAQWKIVQLSDSLDVYRDFITKNPNSRYITNAMDRLEEIYKLFEPELNISTSKDSITFHINGRFPPFNLTMNHLDSQYVFLRKNTLGIGDEFSLGIDDLKLSPGRLKIELTDSNETTVLDTITIDEKNVEIGESIVGVKMSKSEFELGEMLIGEKLKFDFYVKNIFNRSVQLSSIVTDLEGLVIQFSKQKIRPGEKTKITVIFHSNKSNILDDEFTKDITFYLKKQSGLVNQEKITIKGLVSTTVRDNRDGRIYKIIYLANKIWFAENVNFDINSYTNLKRPYSTSPKTGGITYVFFDAKENVCPAGWKLPTEKNWIDLFKLYGEFDVATSDTTRTAYNELAKGGISQFNMDYNKKYWTDSFVEEDMFVVHSLSYPSNQIISVPNMKGAYNLCRCIKDGSLNRVIQ